MSVLEAYVADIAIKMMLMAPITMVRHVREENFEVIDRCPDKLVVEALNPEIRLL